MGLPIDTSNTLKMSFFGVQRHRTPPSVETVRADIKVAVEPTRNQDTSFVTLDLQSSNMTFVLNPCPCISAIETLIDISGVPFQPPKEETAESSTSLDINVSMENMSVLLLTDTSDILRGILELELNKVSMKVKAKSNGTCDLVISSVPIMLHAGQILSPSLSGDGVAIDWQRLPYKPILAVEGTRLVASTKEMRSKASSGARAVSVDVEIATDSFLFNASPSTLMALIGFSSSLGPFLEWAKGGAEESERIRLEKETELEEERLSLQYRREALRAMFNSVVRYTSSIAFSTTSLPEIISLILPFLP